MSHRNKYRNAVPQAQTVSQAQAGGPQAGSPREAAAVLEPPADQAQNDTESGPPEPEELEADLGPAAEECAAEPVQSPAEPPTTGTWCRPPADHPITSSAPDMLTMIAGLDGRGSPEWPRPASECPECSPFTVEWPWAGEPDPAVGETLGWNWSKREICTVVGVPSMVDAPAGTVPWPHTLTVEIQPMPEELITGEVKVFDLMSGQRLDVEWYTRWNRAYSQFAKDAEGDPIPDESGVDAKRVVGTGWLAVVLDQ